MRCFFTKKRAIFLIWMFIIILITGCLELTKDKSKASIEFSTNIEKNLKLPSFWNLTGTFMETYVYHNGDIVTEEQYKTVAGILIDETLENFTWSKTVATYPWCNGSGTKEDPYIIEKVYIDGQFAGTTYLIYSNILIRHSRAYFTIRDSSLHKAGPNDNAGIYLYNTTNGVLTRNNCTYNRNGIYLFESHNNSITYNRMLSNHSLIVGTGKAIFLDGYGNGNGSCNNTVEDNIIINHYDGIGVWFSLNNKINRNFLNNTLFGHFPDTGLYLCDSNYSYITFNTFAGDYADYSNPYGDSIINEQNCVGNTIENNFGGSGTSISSSLKIQNSESWFYLENSNYNYIYGNKLIRTHPITKSVIPGYIIYIIIIIEVMSVIAISILFKKKLTNVIEK